MIAFGEAPACARPAAGGWGLPAWRRGRLAGLMAVVLACLFGLAGPASADEAHERPVSAPSGQAQGPQKECPVMIGKAIDPNIFSTYKGQKVYFCCQFCKAAFEKEPEKYLHRLPQFATATAAGGGHEEAHEEHEHGWNPAGLIEPMGICTLALLAVTVALGVFRRLKPRPMFKWHKILGVAALVSGAVHAILVLLAH